MNESALGRKSHVRSAHQNDKAKQGFYMLGGIAREDSVGERALGMRPAECCRI